MTREVVIVDALRTPIGSFGGAYRNVSAVTLGATVVKGLLERTGIDPNMVDEVIMGNVLSAGLGQNVARQIAIHGGIPQDKTALTIDMVCGSGLRAVQLAAQSIALGQADVIIAGGSENMSQAAHAIPNARFGPKYGDTQMIDTLIHDGLTDAFENIHMGITAENMAREFNISREDQDGIAQLSQERAIQAIDAGRFEAEIIPVEVEDRKGHQRRVDTDEYPRRGSSIESLAALKPAFDKEDGTVTAGNAAGLNDGAAAVVVMSRERAEELGLPILATIVSYANKGVDPRIMGTGPIPATMSALEQAGITVEDLDLVEANEAFGVQAYHVIQTLGLDLAKTNVNGGSIALGHPLGSSGARILVTLLHEMKRRHAQYGLATLCIGGGMGTAMVVKGEPEK